MKTILVNLEVSDVLPSMLTCALLVGRRFGSYIEGLHVRPAQPDVVAAGADGFVAAAPELVASFERQATERARLAREAFDGFMQEHGLARGMTGAEGEVTADWRQESALADVALGNRGRVFDVIVVGRPIKGQVHPTMGALETALFESGRPLLIAPPTAPGTLGDTIVIAWNGSTESARSVAFAMPLLEQAKRVFVISIEGGTVPGPPGDDLARNLDRAGIAVEAVHAQPAGRTTGEALLEESAARGCDLMVKGAFTHSRLRQMIFGGATSHIVQAAEIPVLMAH